jgi:hypothetical protein
MKEISKNEHEVLALTKKDRRSGGNKIRPGGSKVTVSSLLDAEQYGGLSNLTFPGIPEIGDYIVVVPGEYKDAEAWMSRPHGKAKRYESGDTIRLTYDQALSLMVSECGRVKPLKGSGIPDLRFLALFKWMEPVDLTKALPLKQQQRDREKHQRIQAEKEKVKFNTALELASLTKNTSYIKDWRK